MKNTLLNVLIVYAIISLGGWLFVCLCASDLIRMRRRKATEVGRTTGTVVEHVRYEKRSTRRGRRRTTVVCFPVVEFSAEGQSLRLEADIGVHDGAPAVGDKVEVCYDAESPSHFHLEGQLDRVMRCDGVAAIIGVVWIVASVFIVRDIF